MSTRRFLVTRACRGLLVWYAEARTAEHALELVWPATEEGIMGLVDEGGAAAPHLEAFLEPEHFTVREITRWPRDAIITKPLGRRA